VSATFTGAAFDDDLEPTLYVRLAIVRQRNDWLPGIERR